LLVRDLIEANRANFTPAERRVIPLLKDESLALELQSVTKIAEAAEVSTPTVIRLARKLGFQGFPDLQHALRAELAERIKRPLAKLEAKVARDVDDHIVGKFATNVVDNVNQTLNNLDYERFDEAADLLSKPAQRVLLIGGRITRPIASYLANHLHIIRPNVSLLGPAQSDWPQAVLDMDNKTVMIVFDIRRYEKKIERLAQFAEERGATIVLFTDQWGSPIENKARICFRANIAAPSSWDSSAAIVMLVEALIADVQRKSSKKTASRIDDMERMLNDTEIF